MTYTYGAETPSNHEREVSFELCLDDRELDAVASFEMEYEEAEPDAGFGGGWYAELTGALIGNLKLSRTQVQDMMGKPWVVAQEQAAAEGAS